MLLTEIKAAMVLCCAMLGYGIIALPSACSEVGYVGATVLLIFTAVLTFLIFELVFKSSKILSKQNMTIDESVESPKISFFTLSECVHSNFANFTSFVTIIFLFLVTVTYHYNIVLFSNKVIQMIFTDNTPPFILAIAVSVIELGFTIPKDLSVLSKVSYISVGCCFFVACLSVFYASMKPEIKVTVIDLSGFSNSFGTFICAIGCSTTIPVVFNELKKDANTTLVSIYAASIGTIMCMIMGIAGYFCGGDDMKARGVGNILDYLALSGTPIRKAISEGSFDTDGICIIVACAFFALILIITYAITCYTARLLIMELISKITGNSSNKSSMKTISMILGPLYVCLTAIIALKAYSTTFFNWNGMICGNYITFIVPAVCFIAVSGKKNKLWFTISILIIIIAVSSMVYSIVMELINVFNQ